MSKPGYYAEGEPKPDIKAPPGYQGCASTSWHKHTESPGSCKTCKATYGTYDEDCNGCGNKNGKCGLYPLSVTRVSVYLCSKCFPFCIFE